jgi:hypothetical protein
MEIPVPHTLVISFAAAVASVLLSFTAVPAHADPVAVLEHITVGEGKSSAATGHEVAAWSAAKPDSVTAG